MSGNDKSYDIFISYARKDNLDGSVTKIIKYIGKRYEELFPGSSLSFFFDKEEIRSGYYWEHVLKTSLKSSKVMLAFISSNYLESMWCQKEWYFWNEVERSRGVLGTMLNPIYYKVIEELEEDNTSHFDESSLPELSALLQNSAKEFFHLAISIRQFTDLRAWDYTDNEKNIQSETIKIIDELLKDIHAQIARVEQIRVDDANFIRNNQNFCGRFAELKTIHDSFADGIGVISIITGIPGEGKTALAIAYGYAYREEYKGGCFWVDCSGLNSLMKCFIKLGENVGFTFSSKYNDNTHFTQVWNWLLERENGKCLVVLDNIDEQSLFTMRSFETLNAGDDKVHIIITTSCRCDNLSGFVKPFALKSLSHTDSLHLLHRFREYGEDEKKAVLFIISALDSHALSLSLVGAYLKKQANRKSYTDFAREIKLQGEINVVNHAKASSEGAIGYQQFDQIEQLVTPIINDFSEEEKNTLKLFSLVTADNIPSIWIEEALVHLQTNKNAQQTCISTMEQIFDKLAGYNFLQEQSLDKFSVASGEENGFYDFLDDFDEIDVSESKKNVLYYHMHKIIRSVVKKILFEEQEKNIYYSTLYLTAKIAVTNQITGHPSWPLRAFLSLLASFNTWFIERNFSENFLELPEKLINMIIRGSGYNSEAMLLSNYSLKYLNKLKSEDNKLQHAKYLTTRGQIYYNQSDWDLAIVDYSKARIILDEYLEQNSDGFNLQRVHLLDYIGEAKSLNGSIEDAIEVHYTALKYIEDEIANNKDNIELQTEQCYTYDHLGEAYCKLKNIVKAKEYYEKAYFFRKKLYETDTSNNFLYKRILATSYENLGEICRENNPGTSLEHYENCKNLRDELYQKDPSNVVIQRDLAVSYNKIGDCYLRDNDFENALTNYTHAYKLRHCILAGDNENASFIYDFTISLRNLANVHMKLNQEEKSLKFFMEALKLREGLSLNYPANWKYMQGLISIQHDIISLYRSQGQVDEEVKFLKLEEKTISEIIHLLSDNTIYRDGYNNELEKIKTRLLEL